MREGTSEVLIGMPGVSDLHPWCLDFQTHWRRVQGVVAKPGDIKRLSKVLLMAKVGRPGLHVVLDNLSTHNTPDVVSWLTENPRVHFHFTPVGSSWIGGSGSMRSRTVRAGAGPEHRDSAEVLRADACFR